jgi:hypothetical protein
MREQKTNILVSSSPSCGNPGTVEIDACPGSLLIFQNCAPQYHMMFSAVIKARSAPLALAATLGPLVRGVVEGLVGSATLVAARADADIEEIADSAGCRVLVEADWAEGFRRVVANAGGAPLIVMDTGLMLGQEFWPVLADSLPLLGDRPAVTEAEKPASLIARLFAGASAAPGRDQVLLLPGSVSRQVAQSKADPFTFRYPNLAHLPVKARRVPE